MMDLNRLFKNYFDSLLISDDSIRKFTEIHLQRLKADNAGGQFNPIVADTENAYNQYFGSITSEDMKFSEQQGMTISVTNTLKKFRLFVQKNEGLIRSQFGKTSAEYQEFIPFGMKEYWHLNLSNVQSAMERFYKAADRHSATIGSDLKNTAETILNEFKEARKKQLIKKGEVSEKKTSTHERRKTLELQLIKNLHYIGYLFPADVDKCNNYYDQSFLRRKKKKQKQS